MNIEQHSVFLSDLIKHVRKGQLLPAAFQRPYVWTKQDVLALIESVLMGYPIGGFLLWSPWSASFLPQVSRSRLGPIHCPADVDLARVSILLDGQNRLATMAWLARDVTEPLPADLAGQENLTWGSGEHLVADMALKRLFFVPAAEIDAGLRMPAASLFNGQLNAEIRKREKTLWRNYSTSDVDDGMDWLDNVTTAFREARVVVTDIQRATVEEAKHAFLHICKVGVPMSEDDFNIATNWVSPELPAQ